MNELTERTRPVRTGNRNPTSVWIETRTENKQQSYRIRWVDPQSGRVLSEACGRDRALARTRRDAKKQELRDALSGRLPDKAVSHLIAELDTFMVGKSRHTIRKTKDSLNNLVALCGDRRLVHLDRGFVMQFRAARLAAKVATATVNKDLRQIKSALSYAVDAGWLRTNPLWRWKAMQLREPEKRIRVIEKAEFDVLLTPEACPNPTFRVLLIVGYHQGLRRTELVNLRWTAADLDRGILRVENVAEAGEFTKSRKNRVLPMHEVVRRELAALYAHVPKVVDGGTQRPKYPHVFTWDDGQPYVADWATHEFGRVVERSGVAHCTLHDLRRSFSTIAQRAGVDKATVKDLGGWSTIGVVEKHYSGEVPEVFERAMKQIANAQVAAG